MKKLICISIPIVILFIGCTLLTDPNSVLNDPNLVINNPVVPVILDSVGTVGTAVGGPIGSVILVVATVLSTLWGSWQRNRKKQSESKYSTLEKVTATVVQTIDEVSDLTLSDNTTIGDTVKAKVKARLQNNDVYQAGKAIISGLKA